MNEFKKSFLLKFCVATCLLVVMGAFVAAQTPITITGTVNDNQGETLPGVNVVVQGTTMGTVTSVDGTYSISVPNEQAVLEFSFLGYSTVLVPVGSNRIISPTLTDESTELDEVVVVGYGTMRRADLTGSVASVGSEEITQRGTTSVMDALQGALAGVDITSNSSRPGVGFNIRVRGQNSMNPGNPLFVVDGIVTPDIDFLNPQDIVKIDILKDA